MFDFEFFDGASDLGNDFDSSGSLSEYDIDGSIFNDTTWGSFGENSSASIINEPSLTNFEIQDFDNWHSDLYGEPLQDSLVWHQQTTPFTCGVVSSEMVLKMFGVEISEAELVYEATQEGLLTDNGITTEGIQKILDNHGIDTHLTSGSISDLQSELGDGHKIVIPLDSGEIWGEDSPYEDFFGERADHAVVLTGIDAERGVVFLNDPGHPDGQAMQVDIDKFTDAWDDSGNQFIASDESPSIA